MSRIFVLSCGAALMLLTPADAYDRRGRTPSYEVEDLERNPPPGWKVEKNWAPLGDRGNPLRKDYDKWDCRVDSSSRTIRCDK